MNQRANSRIDALLVPRRVTGLLLSLSLGFLVVIASGCNQGGAKNNVSGTVQFNGQMVGGTITFVGADGKSVDAPLMNGKYQMEDPPLGEVKVRVVGNPKPATGRTGSADEKKETLAKGGKDVSGQLAGGGASTPSMGVDPPAKYAKDSDLKVTVKGGKKEKIDIDLK